MNSSPPSSVEDALKLAAHHRAAMGSRRDIGIKIAIGLVTFDLVTVKFCVDAAPHVSHPSELAMAIRLMAWGAFVVLCGLLAQIEAKNRLDRIKYRHAEEQANAIASGSHPSGVALPVETRWRSFVNSWASTWPLAGMLLLTITLTVLAGTVSHAK